MVRAGAGLIYARIRERVMTARIEGANLMKWLSVVTLMALAGSATAATRDGQVDDEQTTTPTHRIQVLEDPYELASFYRHDGYQVRAARIVRDGRTTISPYDVASFYRSGSRSSSFSYGQRWVVREKAYERE